MKAMVYLRENHAICFCFFQSQADQGKLDCDLNYELRTLQRMIADGKKSLFDFLRAPLFLSS